ALGNEQNRVKSKGAIDFLTLNTLAEYGLTDKKIAPFIFGGVRADYAFNGTLIDVGKLTDKLIFGATGGAGIKYSLDKVQFGLRCAYLYDITKVEKTDIRSFLISLQFGYTIK